MPNEEASRLRHSVGEQAPDSQDPPAETPAHRQRGPYRISEVTRDQELLRDPEVAAFSQAVARIKDPRARAHLAWLVHALARAKKRAEP
jgi:hypothetical protein